MGTTSEKLTYLNGTKQKLKQAINNIGGEVTDETTFREYANQLQNVYDNLPKTEYQEGTEITLSNTLKGKLDYDNGVVGIGQSSQESTQGYQLISLKDGTYTGNSGVTIKVENGKCTINGTPSASEVIPVQLKDNLSLTNGQTYTLYGFNDVANSNVAFRPRIDEGFFQVAFGTTNNVESKTYNGTSISVAYIGIRVGSGTTITNLVCKPMLISGNDTTKSYEQYTGGQASPNPSYPQEIKCVAGRNILKDSGWERKTAWNETQIQDSTTRIMSDYIEVDEHLNYYATIQSTSYCFGNVVLYNSKKVQFATYYNAVSQVINGTRSIELKFPTNTKYVRFVVRNTDNTSEVTLDELATIKPMLEEGTQPTPYLPYNTIEEVVGGINKLSYAEAQTEMVGTLECKSNGDGTYTMNGTSSISGGYDFQISSGYTIKEGDYFFINNNKTNSNVAIALKTSSEDQITAPACNVVNRSLDLTPYVGKTINYIRLYANSGQTLDNLVVKPFIYNSSTQVPFEPYITPKAYQLSLGDIKPCRIGNYIDHIYRTYGKNLFDGDVEQGAISSTVGETYAQNKVNNATRIRTKDLIALNKSEIYTISCKSGYNVVVQAFDDNKTLYVTSGTNAWVSSATFTNIPYIAVAIRKVSEENIVPSEIGNARVQLEKGSTATEYNPFGEGEWYIHKVIGDTLFSGNENWSSAEFGTNSFQINVAEAYQNITDGSPVMCMSNLFRGVRFFYRTTSGDNIVYLTAGGLLYIRNTSYTSLADFKSMLSTNNLIAYYVLNEAVETEITGTLAEQLEAWYNAHSNNGTTIITSNGNLPMIIKVRALKGE